MNIKFCSQCGEAVSLTRPDDDNRDRFVCSTCETIHYQNPNMVTGCIVAWEDKVLLCKRAIEPRYGLWTVPAGFMENGETTLEGAARETLEEANARVDVHELYMTVNLPYINQVYMLFRSSLLDLNFSAGVESLDVQLFSEDEIPWNEIAFEAVNHALKTYFKDRKKGKFEAHMADIKKSPDELQNYELSEVY